MGAGGHHREAVMRRHLADPPAQLGEGPPGLREVEGRRSRNLNLRLQHLALDIAGQVLPARLEEVACAGARYVAFLRVVHEIFFFDPEAIILPHPNVSIKKLVGTAADANLRDTTSFRLAPIGARLGRADDGVTGAKGWAIGMSCCQSS
jgi:hypothetical protein